MKFGRSIALAGSALLFGGCMTAQKYDTIREAMIGSPPLVDEMVARCVRDFTKNEQAKDYFAKMMKLRSKDDVAPVGCRRVYSAIVSGELAYEDYNSMMTANPNVRVIRVLQGRKA